MVMNSMYCVWPNSTLCKIKHQINNSSMCQSEKQKKIEELDIEVVHQELIKFFNC